MASFWSDYFKNRILDHMRGIATYTPAATSFFALMTAAPTPAGGGTQVALLPRLEVNNSSTSWNAASAGVSTNKNDLALVTGAPSDLGTIVGIAEYDASSSGNLLTYGDLTTPKELLTGMDFIVQAVAGQFTYVEYSIPTQATAMIYLT